jgi:hypothetical protein
MMWALLSEWKILLPWDSISKFIWHPNENCNKENKWACYNNELRSCIKSKNKQLETSTYFMLLVRTIYLCCTKFEDREMNYGLKSEIANKVTSWCLSSWFNIHKNWLQASEPKPRKIYITKVGSDLIEYHLLNSSRTIF